MPDSPLPPLPARLETERLLLRPIHSADLRFFTELHGDPAVVRYLGGDGTPRTPEMTRAWLERMVRWYDEEHLGPYAIVRREDGRLVGRSGLSVFEVERHPSRADGIALATWGRGSAPAGTEVESVLELGYVVSPRVWGQGIATEAARRWMTYAFEERGEPRVSSVIHPDNVGSLRVAAKNGMQPEERAVRLDGRAYRIYRMLRGAWAGSGPGAPYL